MSCISVNLESIINLEFYTGIYYSIRTVAYQGFRSTAFQSLQNILLCAMGHLGDKNARIHKKKNKSGQEIAKFVHNYISELNGVGQRTFKGLTEEIKWKRPPVQTVKINFDGAYDERNQQSASGVAV
ncbi:hypothetical protein GOBAR_AA25832 [Gossypium barbadense]|uniref:Uncharacterized protein n=1 Tax=Gossypium barbadense TaxID=3634 RepID=A0A2P5WUU4_GOSBA|nr:hypothetical protein GOBAR_AA25832 [Gossypium barbadense]